MNMKPTEAETQKVAIISGGSRGLGQVLVQRLRANDWHVATFSRTATPFIEECQTFSATAFYWEAVDMTTLSSLTDFVNHVVRQFGRVDLLVNNAAVLHQELFLTLSLAKIDSLITANLIAPLVLTQACIRVMSRQQQGTIVNVSSINAIRGYRGGVPYAAAKAGLDSVSRSLAREVGPLGIRVNSVVPGYFDSTMTSNVSLTNVERILNRTPLKRLATVEDIADAVCFLASPSAACITGQTLVVDGGITC
jgi:3-oxoacyl-[acyl-carrier protein] reductase